MKSCYVAKRYFWDGMCFKCILDLIMLNEYEYL